MAHDKIMEEISRLFYGDEVYLKCPKSNILKIGLVLKGTEWKVNDDSKKIEVLWHPDGNKEMISANKVRLFIVFIFFFSNLIMIILTLLRSL